MSGHRRIEPNPILSEIELSSKSLTVLVGPPSHEFPRQNADDVGPIDPGLSVLASNGTWKNQKTGAFRTSDFLYSHPKKVSRFGVFGRGYQALNEVLFKKSISRRQGVRRARQPFNGFRLETFPDGITHGQSPN